MAKTVERELVVRAQAYARATGIPIGDRQVNYDNPHRWDGQSLAWPITMTKNPAQMYVHEANHWLLAPRERRGHPEYGLGRSPTAYHDSAIRPVTTVEEYQCHFEECLVATFDTIILQELGATKEQIWEWWHEVWDEWAGYILMADGEKLAGWESKTAREEGMQRLDAALAKIRRFKFMTPERERILQKLLGSILPHTQKTLARKRRRK